VNIDIKSLKMSFISLFTSEIKGASKEEIDFITTFNDNEIFNCVKKINPYFIFRYVIQYKIKDLNFMDNFLSLSQLSEVDNIRDFLKYITYLSIKENNINLFSIILKHSKTLNIEYYFFIDFIINKEMFQIDISFEFIEQLLMKYEDEDFSFFDEIFIKSYDENNLKQIKFLTKHAKIGIEIISMCLMKDIFLCIKHNEEMKEKEVFTYLFFHIPSIEDYVDYFAETFLICDGNINASDDEKKIYKDKIHNILSKM
jgi:hypothetical protein